MNLTNTLTANPDVIKKWASRDKCWMCKHRFKAPVILPVKVQKPGVYQPNFNPEVLFHLSDTHGLPPETVVAWIKGSVYGLELNDLGIRK